ncbi:MAG: SRPBCC family protein [Cyclobacteriaceae bacterium]
MIILYIILGIIALVLLLAAIMPRNFTVSADIVINKPVATVFDYVVHLRNQEKWSVWILADPNVKITYTGTDGTVGFTAAWTSENKNVGVGAQEIKAIVPNKRYDVELRFEKPFKATNHAYTTTDAVDANSTRVTTVFYGSNPYPMNLMIPMVKGMLTRDLNRNMTNMKGQLE